MKLHAVLGALLAAGTLGVNAAQAAPDQSTAPRVPDAELAATATTPIPTLQVVDPAKVETWVGASPPSRIIYLNRCKNGCTVYPGNEDSRTQHSSIINGTGTLSAFSFNDSTWNSIVSCVKATYAPFDVTITDVDPGNVPHWETFVAGYPQDVGMQSGVAGVSPFTCGVISNSITYAFANVYAGASDAAEQICWTVAQETAHSFGLDHEYLASDPMTYLDGSLPKRFQNQTAQCGRYQVENCLCGGTGQNSYKMIFTLFGSPTPTPPTVNITKPTNGAQVSPGFGVVADITDDQGVDKAELYVDGKLVQTLNAPPYAFNAPSDLGDGTHHVEVRGYDLQNTPGSGFIDVVIGAPCTKPGDCGQDKTCVDGRCVAAPGTPGGLGEVCTDPTMCASGICGNDGAGNAYCTEQCDLSANGCPSGFSCLPTGGDQGVCWPGGDNGTSAGGCNAEGGDASGPMMIGLGLLFALMIVRRRRQA
jgi:MYXO-CTERM domain-containing protein